MNKMNFIIHASTPQMLNKVKVNINLKRYRKFATQIMKIIVVLARIHISSLSDVINFLSLSLQLRVCRFIEI